VIRRTHAQLGIQIRKKKYLPESTSEQRISVCNNGCVTMAAGKLCKRKISCTNLSATLIAEKGCLIGMKCPYLEKESVITGTQL
jgi:hypothetical protein